MSDLAQLTIADAKREYQSQRASAEKAIAQVSDADFFRALDDEENSIALIMKHVGGNLHSRWRDFLTTDGEKADRNRDGEFEPGDETRDVVLGIWSRGFDTLYATLDSLQPNDLLATVTIRSEPMPALQALHRSLAHTAHHCGQIVMLSKHWCGTEWRTISMAKPNRNR